MAAKKKTPKKPPRQVIQIAPVGSDGTTTNELYALCNDGTIWCNSLNGDEWYLIVPIPEDEVDL